MKFQKFLPLLAVAFMVFSCQEEDVTVNPESADLAAAIGPQYDYSSLGAYTGVFSTMDSDLRGTVSVQVRAEGASTAVLTLNNGNATKWGSTDLVIANTEINNMVFSSYAGNFKFSVNANGENPVISDVNYTERASSIVVMKEISTRGPNTPLTGFYTIDGDMATNTWSIIFGGTGEGNDTAISTQILRNGTDDIGAATGNEQSECFVDVPEDGFTECILTGSSASFMQGGVSLTIDFNGFHTYNTGATDCSEVEGTWSSSVGGITGTFTNDFLCTTQPGDTSATAIVITPAATGTGCDTTTNTVNLAANGGYTLSSEVSSCGGSARDAWFTYTSTQNALNFSPRSGSSTLLPIVTVFTNGGFGLVEVGCGAGNFGGLGTISVTGWNAGDVLFIQVQANSEVPFCLEEATIATGPPVNDECVGALDITCGESIAINTTNASGGTTGSRPFNDVFYNLTGTTAGDEVTVSLCGSSFDTYLRILDGCDGTLVGISDDAGACSPQSLYTFVSNGSNYIIRAGGYGASNAGDITMDVSCFTPPPPPPPAAAFTCGDVFMDSGNGADGGYANGESEEYRFDAGMGLLPVLTFTVFEAETCCDNMRIYDGVDATATEFTSLNGGTAPYNGTELLNAVVTGTTQNLFITWTSDGSVNGGEGWSADVTCVMSRPDDAPVSRHFTQTELQAQRAECLKSQASKVQALDNIKMNK